MHETALVIRGPFHSSNAAVLPYCITGCWWRGGESTATCEICNNVAIVQTWLRSGRPTLRCIRDPQVQRVCELGTPTQIGRARSDHALNGAQRFVTVETQHEQRPSQRLYAVAECLPAVM